VWEQSLGLIAAPSVELQQHLAPHCICFALKASGKTVRNLKINNKRCTFRKKKLTDIIAFDNGPPFWADLL